MNPVSLFSSRRRSAPFWYFQAAALMAAIAFTTPAAYADAGHDHGSEAPAAASGNGPSRQADGGVFLPKPTQRQLELRTVVAEEKSLPRTVELTGRVIADPNAGGKVQPMQPGRIEAGPRGLPRLGQSVRKGETLAVVRASVGAIERANQLSQTAELRGNLALARQRIARLEQLEGTVPRKEIDSARAEVASLAERLTAVNASTSATETLVAPVAGVIAATNVTLGQVVDARELLFEIVDPARLVIEASAYDASLPGNIAGASASTGSGMSAPLRFTGAGGTLREGALLLHFATAGTAATAATKNLPSAAAPMPMAVNQPVKVLVQTREQVKGFAVPAASVVKNAANQDVVWVHTDAEQFAARTVRLIALDGATVSVIDGLRNGDRVVTQGAPLLNQVR